MTVTIFFFRTLARASAIFAGAALVLLHPTLEWRNGAPMTVGAQQAPRAAAVEGAVSDLSSPDPAVRTHAAWAIGIIGR